MAVTDEGMVTVVRYGHPKKALLLIVVTVGGIVTLPFFDFEHRISVV